MYARLDERFILSSLAEGIDASEAAAELGDSSGSHSPRRQLTTESPNSLLHSSAPNLSPSLTQQSSESSAPGGRARLTQTGSAPADKRWCPEEDLSRAYNHYRCLQVTKFLVNVEKLVVLNSEFFLIFRLLIP
jgi:hypothetical protein